MRKLVIVICALSLFVGQMCYTPVVLAGGHGSLSLSNATDVKPHSSTSNPKSDPGANTSGLGKEYTSTKKGDQAAAADMLITVVGIVLQVLKQGIFTELHLLMLDPDVTWFPLGISGDWVGPIFTLASAAVNQFLRDQTKITASFTGTDGYVTDKWVGPAPRNKVTKIMGEVTGGGIESKHFDTLKYDPNEYEGLSESDKKNPTPIKLMRYREDTLIEDQRNLSNVQTQNWDLLYRSQQRAIKSMAGAMKLKGQLRVLAGVDDIVQAGYTSQPDALNTIAARRALHDSLMLLKMQVVAARVKIRANAMELEFKPKKKESETLDEEPVAPSNPGYGSGDASGRD